MKKQLFILSYLVLMLSASACHSEMEEVANEMETTKTIAEDVQMKFKAEFAEDALTRTQLDGTRVKWTAGDKIKVYTLSGSSYNSAEFTTSTAGYVVDFTGSISTSSDYYAFYPGESAGGIITLNGTSKKTVALDIPTSQTAVANSFGEGLNLAYAHTTDIDSKLTFKNVCGLIGFKLSGSGVSKVKKVRVVPNKNSSGDIPKLSGKAYIKVEDGEIYYLNSDNAYVEMTGDFNTKATYYMVAAPADLDKGFTISFYDSSGNEYAKKGVKDATIQSSHILDLGTIEISSNDFANGAVTTYQTSTKIKAVPFVIIPEGFTKDQMNDFHTKAKDVFEFIFSVDPYKEYSDYFNMYIIDAVSNEAGADVTEGTQKDTFFDAGWSESSYGDMSANDELVYSFVSAHCPDIVEGKATIDETAIIMIINDERYGGRCRSTSAGRGYAMVPITNNGEDLTWGGMNGAYGKTNTGNWMNTALHEGGGHMFGRLMDEYITNYRTKNGEYEGHSWSPLQFGLNVSTDATGSLWSHLIPATQGMKETKKFLHVDVYQIKNEANPNWGLYRSEEVSAMDDNRAYFSAWQRYLIAKRIHDIVGEDFDYDSFISKDDQYLAIQAGTANRGKEGLITTTYNGLTPSYGANTRSNYVEENVKIYPPLPPPVFTDLKEPKIELEKLPLIY